jgi:hypothetical protein
MLDDIARVCRDSLDEAAAVLLLNILCMRCGWSRGEERRGEERRG